MAQQVQERNQDATVYVGNLDERVTDTLLWELFLQAGPVVNVHVPKDRVTSLHQGYGFVEFMTEEDADYATKIMNMIKLFGRPIRVNKASSDRRNAESEAYSANLFIGNLDPDVDEKLLYDTFSAFGPIVQTPRVQRDNETGNSKGFAFIVFDTFEAADMAIEAMNGQYLANKPIVVTYAFKKDAKGERHGSAKDRMLAAQFKKEKAIAAAPNRLFAGDAAKTPAMTPIAPTPVNPVSPFPGFTPPPTTQFYANGTVPTPPNPALNFAGFSTTPTFQGAGFPAFPNFGQQGFPAPPPPTPPFAVPPPPQFNTSAQ